MNWQLLEAFEEAELEGEIVGVERCCLFVIFMKSFTNSSTFGAVWEVLGVAWW